MRLHEENFRAILYELLDENPFAVRPLLKILEISFTDSVNTLAVTCEERPTLKVNLSFINEHCKTDSHVKALICHEFLHVLLNHTENHRLATPLHNIAFDAVINAIIHRTMGNDYSSMMSSYYNTSTLPLCLLRPPPARFSDDLAIPMRHIWYSLYSGKLVADDILDILKELASEKSSFTAYSLDDLLGNHAEHPVIFGTEISDALNECLKQMNGSDIWRNPGMRGVGAEEYKGSFVAQECQEIKTWKKKATAVLRTHIVPDRKSRLHEEVPLEYRLPLMNEQDKRAFLRSSWSPFIPDATWGTSKQKPRGTANIYLDVSGSMNSEMPYLVALLVKLRSYIKMPFWAFSDVVAKADIKNGQLVSNTTGGTSMNCVLKHIALNKPISAIVVTDGYIEEVDRRLLAAVKDIKVHAIISRNGDPSKLAKAGIPYTQLERLPS